MTDAALQLHPDRLLPAEPTTRGIARRLYAEVRDLPIISPHGHVPPDWIAEDVPFGDPTSLLISPDHYVTRLLHANGVPLETLGAGGTAPSDGPRAAWRALCTHWAAFRGTPSRFWLESELTEIFGVMERPAAATADTIYDQVAATPPRRGRGAGDGARPGRRQPEGGVQAVTGTALRRLDRARDGRPAAPIRIAHLGPGNFFRAHQAWYTEHAPDAADWGIAAFAGRRGAVARELAAQDGLYTLLVRTADGDRPEVVSAVSSVSAELDDWRRCFARPELALVTTTVTEAGYRRAADGGLDRDDPEVAADIAALQAFLGGDHGTNADVVTAPAKLALGLAVRRTHDLPGLAVVPCDNVPDNGAMVARVVGELAAAADTSRMLREILDRGGLGRVLGARASVHWFRDAAYYTRRGWRGRWATAGGGVLMNQAIHTLDLLQWFVGPVTDVRGTVATLALPHVIEVEDTAALRLQHRTATGDTVPSVFHATNGHVENAPVTVEIVTEHARLRLDTDLTVAHDDGRVETFHPAAAASGERAYWGASHGLLIDDFYRHVRAGKHFWIDAPAALETLRVIQAAYDQCPGLGR